VQIIVNLYRNHPTQKILIVTHSNAALNDLFEKIMERDVAPRHLLRLGSGETELRETLALSGAGGGGKGQGEAFSKQGRVNWSLARRLQLLGQVQKLSASIGIPGDMGNTCETAAYFQLEHIQSRIERFNIAVATAQSRGTTQSASIESLFPFAQYFADAPAALFRGDWEADLESARGCFTHISKIFEELADYRAFELLRSQNLRSDFLLTKQVNPTILCTHNLRL
jgi:intron-binding protein aquarius